MLTRAYEFSAKEIALDLNDLRPKAADNLSLQDLDVTVYYNAAPGAIADLMVKYANASQSAPARSCRPMESCIAKHAAQFTKRSPRSIA